MAFNYQVGLGSVGSYQVSGKPWITGSTLPGTIEHQITFPSVAKAVTIINTEPSGDPGTADLRVHFNSTGSGNVVSGKHFVTLDDRKDSLTITCKCKEIFISNPGSTSSEYQILVELTGISTNEMFVLTGSGLTD
jgi:hypothetical protein